MNYYFRRPVENPFGLFEVLNVSDFFNDRYRMSVEQQIGALVLYAADGQSCFCDALYVVFLVLLFKSFLTLSLSERCLTLIGGLVLCVANMVAALSFESPICSI